MDQHEYRKQLINIAIPVALQALLSSSFSIIDQIMIGQLGSSSIAAIGVCTSFSSIFIFTGGAIIAAAGIMIAQYIGQKNDLELRKAFYLNLFISIGLSLIFLVLALSIPEQIVSNYTKDPQVIAAAARYLKIFAWIYIPQALINMISTVLRCVDKAIIPTGISFACVILNTCLNYCLIFGHFGLPALGIEGAAIASLISMLVCLVLSVIGLMVVLKKIHLSLHFALGYNSKQIKAYLIMVVPMLISEFQWVIGENIYSSLYGHIGTVALASMSISTTIISLTMGALSGLSQAAGIMVGKQLGEAHFDAAYEVAWKLVKTSFLWAVAVAVCTVAISPLYVSLFNVEEEVKITARKLLLVFALYMPVKTENMVLSGGVLRSGGKTGYVLALNIIGTWGVGIPLGLWATYGLHLSAPYVYAMLSIEEALRLCLCFILYKKRIWMSQLSAS